MRTPGGSWRKAGRARASSFTSPKVRLPSSTSSRTLRLRLMRLMTEGPLSRLTLATFTSGQVYDDAIIDPRDTRTVLGIALSAALSAGVKGAESYGVFRM